MFIQITSKDNNGARELINIYYLIAVKDNGRNGCSLVMKDRNYFITTKESYEEICKLINDKSCIR